MKPVLLIIVCLISSHSLATSCVYPDKIAQSLLENSDCGEISPQGELLFSQKLLAKVDFSADLPACVLVGTGETYSAFYLDKLGNSRSTQFFDNGCDYFKEGLARTFVDEKVAYFDKSLAVSIQTDFEQGAPFYYEHAIVCNGPFVEEKIGEHTLQSGGRCGLIDHEGKVVVAAEYRIEDQDVFTAYINSHNECTPPPVTTEASALCHGRRHARHLDYHSDDWTWYQVRQGDEVWYIDFAQANEPDVKITLELDKATAQWNSIIPQEDIQKDSQKDTLKEKTR